MTDIGIGWTVRIEFGRYYATKTCHYCRGRGVMRDLTHCLCVTWRSDSVHSGKVEKILREGARSAVIQLDSETVVVDDMAAVRIVTLSEA